MTRAVVFASPRKEPETHRIFIDWLSARVPCDGVFKTDDSCTFAHVKVDAAGNAEILCVVALNRWTPNSCEGHIASDGTGRWMSRGFAHTIYQFVFEQAGCSRFNFVSRIENDAANTMHDKLGHKRECFIEDAYGEEQHGWLYGLTRKQWKAGTFARPSRE